MPEAAAGPIFEALVGSEFHDAGETVSEPDQIGPALDRAFASGVPYMVNVLTDPEDVYPRTSNLG